MKYYTKSFEFFADMEIKGAKLSQDFEEGALRFGNWLDSQSADEVNKKLQIATEEQKEEEIPIANEKWTNEDDDARAIGIRGST